MIVQKKRFRVRYTIEKLEQVRQIQGRVAAQAIHGNSTQVFAPTGFSFLRRVTGSKTGLRNKGKIAFRKLRVAHQLKGGRRAAADTYFGAFKKAQRRIQQGCTGIREVGRRAHRQFIRCVVRVIFTGNNLQIQFVGRSDPVFPGKKPRQFAHRTSVYHRKRCNTHERRIAHIEHRAVDVMPVGVGAVENNDLLALFGAGFQHIKQSTDVGVKTRAHILNIKNHHVDAFQVFAGGFAFFSVQ